MNEVQECTQYLQEHLPMCCEVLSKIINDSASTTQEKFNATETLHCIQKYLKGSDVIGG